MPTTDSGTGENATMVLQLLGPLLAGLLGLDGLSALRMDQILARQAIKDNERESHLCTMAFIEAAHEMSIPEAFATAHLALSTTPAQNAALNAASIVPPLQFKIVPQ
jgi:hypothetical protein